MKARVKALGYIVEVTFSHIIHDNGHDIIWYKTPQGASFTKDELEFITTEDDFDYWTRLEHQYAGMAMQGILSNPESELDYIGDDTLPQALAGCAAKLAHALVKKMKEADR